jgi:hypothetical protein
MVSTTPELCYPLLNILDVVPQSPSLLPCTCALFEPSNKDALKNHSEPNRWGTNQSD